MHLSQCPYALARDCLIAAGVIFGLWLEAPLRMLRAHHCLTQAARARGSEARRRGLPAGANPFTDFASRDAWLRGWSSVSRGS